MCVEEQRSGDQGMEHAAEQCEERRGCGALAAVCNVEEGSMGVDAVCSVMCVCLVCVLVQHVHVCMQCV